MITIDSIPIDLNRFPDGTYNIKLEKELLTDIRFNRQYEIAWRFNNPEELLALYYIKKQLDDIFGDINGHLFMPYIPDARMDRIKSPSENFSLKYFAQFINMLNFKKVYVLDPHSNVSLALINNVVCINFDRFIRAIIDENNLHINNSILFFPDEGSMKRYSYLSQKYNIPYRLGIKKRDWETGKIQSLEIIGKEYIKDKNILIIDDICSKGGTFYYSALQLKKLGAKDIFLYASHCENSVEKGEFREDKIPLLEVEFEGMPLINKLYTTNSISNCFFNNKNKIKTFKL